MKPLPLVLLAALLVRPAAAQMDEYTYDHESWKVLGWNDACGVAFEHFYFPKLGEEISTEPLETHIGTAMIPPGKQDYVARWTYEATGRLSFSETAVAKAESELKKGGYARPGYPELIQDAPVGDQPGLAETLLSTVTLQSRLTKAWPPQPEWRWAGGSYSPLGTCGMLVFEHRTDPGHYRLILLRIYNPRVRLDRAYAHASNARLLFNSGTLDIAATEADTAAALAPELPIARYENAAMLALTGYPSKAVVELREAIKLDASYADKAKTDLDFQDLHDRQDFRETTGMRKQIEAETQ